MRDRRVTLVMDADRAGRAAAERWYTQIQSVAKSVLITFPESDLCDSREPMKVLEGGEPVPIRPGFVVLDAGGKSYRQQTPNGPGEVLSNFVFDPTKHITYLDTHGVKAFDGYEGRFEGEIDRLIRIAIPNFRTAQTFREWANAYGKIWSGSKAKHVQSILAEFQALSPFLKKETAVPVAGLWGEDTTYPVFVLPEESGGVIGAAQGAEAWSFASELSKVEVGARYKLVDRDMDEDQAREVVRALLKLNAVDVMTPFLGWLTASFLRKLVPEFPPMGIFGDSGSGKTAMTHAVMRLFCGWQGPEQNLTRTTAHAVVMQSSGINGLPVWWDEYRKGARQDTFRVMSQLIRDSWTGSVSQRGGMNEGNLSKIEQTAAIAPLLLSG